MARGPAAKEVRDPVPARAAIDVPGNPRRRRWQRGPRRPTSGARPFDGHGDADALRFRSRRPNTDADSGALIPYASTTKDTSSTMNG